MKRRSFSAWCALAGLVSTEVLAQTAYPSKPIKLVVVTGPGTTADMIARFCAEKLGRELKTTVLVENKVGAASIVATEYVVKAPADGYTLLFTGAPLFINHSLYQKLPFDSKRDLRMVARLAATSLVLVVPASSPFTSVKQLMDYAQANPSKLNYSTAGSGTISHLATKLLLSTAGVEGTHVPYKGGDTAVFGAAAGEVDMTITGVAGAASLIAGGKLRPLAVTGRQRTDSLKNIPTLDELGYKGYLIASRVGIVVRSETLNAIVDLLSAALFKIIQSAEYEEFRRKNDLDPDWEDAKSWEASKDAEFAYWGKAVALSGAKVN